MVEHRYYYRVLFLGTIDFNDFLTLMTQKMSEKDSKEEILKAFRLFDDDTTGKISFKNLKRVAKELGENLTDEELQVGHSLQIGAGDSDYTRIPSLYALIEA